MPDSCRETALDHLTQMETQGETGYTSKMAFLRRMITRLRNSTCAQLAVADKKDIVPMDVSALGAKSEEGSE